MEKEMRHKEKEMEEEKECNSCLTMKPLKEFSRNKKSKTGRLSKCKPCSKPSPFSKFKTHIKHHYGLEVEKWWEMMISQSGRCYICNTAMDDPVVDHCHKSGKVRAMLCRHCNIAAGAVRDSPDVALKLSKYLMEHKQ